jgi:hypothetical protein
MRIAKSGGRVHRWTPVSAAGPLPGAIAKTFRSGTYTERVISKPTALYRVYSDSARKLGPFWSRDPPKGPLQATIDAALDQNWGNTATNVMKIEIPAGTRIFEGVAAPQRGLVGGGSQVYLEHVEAAWELP